MYNHPLQPRSKHRRKIVKFELMATFISRRKSRFHNRSADRGETRPLAMDHEKRKQYSFQIQLSSLSDRIVSREIINGFSLSTAHLLINNDRIDQSECIE